LRYSGHERLQVQDKELVRRVLQTAQPMRAVQLRRVREAQR
jgi:hypothetical protein